MSSLIFRKGLDLQGAVAGVLAENYHSQVVAQIKENDFTFNAGRLTVHLAREFGFCYGVDRAVDYAYQTRKRFPDRRVCLTGEIIHNPHVNEKLRAQGIRFLTDDGVDVDGLSPTDVVILPAFGALTGGLDATDPAIREAMQPAVAIDAVLPVGGRALHYPLWRTRALEQQEQGILPGLLQ